MGSYSLSLSLLLSLIESTALNKVIIKSVSYEKPVWSNDEESLSSSGSYEPSNWIYALWLSSSEIIKHEYYKKNYAISLKEVEGNSNGWQEYWFMINKKH